jgi:hypothetical protein
MRHKKLRDILTERRADQIATKENDLGQILSDRFNRSTSGCNDAAREHQVAKSQCIGPSRFPATRPVF